MCFFYLITAAAKGQSCRRRHLGPHFGPWWPPAYMMCSARPGMPRCACPLRGRSGSMCVEAHYLATDAAAGRAEKKRISPGFQKKQRFIEVNCRLNVPSSTIGEERATKLQSKLTFSKLKFFKRVDRGEPFIRTRREEPGFPPPICDDKEADGLLKSNTSPQSQRLSAGEDEEEAGGGWLSRNLALFYASSNWPVCKCDSRSWFFSLEVAK